ncbi:hypothetical protein Pelo_19192 [Pelomyxa schiedti]|nr:hypothetical protein Pelo_19192 [Pelomyxa schiedti]
MGATTPADGSVYFRKVHELGLAREALNFATTLLSSATGCSAAFQKCLKVVVFHQPACMHANGSYSDCAGLEEKLLQVHFI